MGFANLQFFNVKCNRGRINVISTEILSRLSELLEMIDGEYQTS